MTMTMAMKLMMVIIVPEVFTPADWLPYNQHQTFYKLKVFQ
jgi:hypothetical protein